MCSLIEEGVQAESERPKMTGSLSSWKYRFALSIFAGGIKQKPGQISPQPLQYRPAPRLTDLHGMTPLHVTAISNRATTQTTAPSGECGVKGIKVMLPDSLRGAHTEDML